MAPSKIDADDVCPVCKSSRYLNPNMKFMIEPSCYHKMCESCVDRIFSSGPAPCPVAGCGKTLRKARFKHPNFEDLAIEKEVDIRARVARILNLRESNFDTLREFNDYEEKKEDMIWNLVKGIDVKATEQELAAHASRHEKTISRNRVIEEEEAADVRHQAAARLKNSALAREAALKEVEQEKADRAAGRKAVVDRLATSKLGDVSAAAFSDSTATRKQSSLRRTAPARNAATAVPAASGGGAMAGLEFRGLKKEASPPAPEKPYDPFGGMEIIPEYYTLQDTYEHQWSLRARTDLAFTAGGYDVREYYARAQIDAHAGLGVFIGVELSSK